MIGHGQIDNPDAVFLKRVTDRGRSTAPHLPKIADTEGGTVRHIAVPGHHGSLVVFRRQDVPFIRQVQDLPVNGPVLFRPAVRLGSAGNGQ